MGNTLQFENSDGTITVTEFVDLINFFDKSLLVGCELERVVPLDISRTADIFHTQRSSGDYRTTRVRNDYNICTVKYDGTFEYGNELIFSGNTENLEWNYQHLKKIEDKLTKLNAVVYSPKTSTHTTILTETDIKIHPVVLKNIFNITRAFSSALYWLGGGDKRTIIRHGCRQYATTINSVNPVGKTISELQSTLRNSNSSGTKYRQLNIGKQKVIGDKLSGLIIEFRAIDGIRVPSVIASNMMLYKALVYKAVELSTEGVVQVESLSSDWTKNKQITDHLLIGEATVADMKFLKTEAKKLVLFLSAYLKKIDPNIVPILLELAEKPASQRMDKKVEIIDKELYKNPKKLNQKEQELLDTIIKAYIQADDLIQWKKKTAEKCDCSVRYIEKMLNKIQEITKLKIVFDSELETMRVD